MRITTNMIMRNYENNLTNSLGGLESSRKQVETGRRFQQSYEDPSAAAKGAVLDRRYSRNADYTNTAKNSQKWVESQEDVLNQISKIVTTIDENYSVSSMNDPSGQTGRSAYAASIREMQRSMVNILNTTYGDSFLFAGADGSNAPFELSEDGMTLTYQGVDVNKTKEMTELANEHAYVDIGFGLEFDADGNVISSSAFDTALPGIEVVGYGKTGGDDADGGMSNNLIVLAGQMAELLEADEFNRAAYSELWTQFHDKADEMENVYAKLGSREQLLESTQAKLSSEKLNLQEQWNDTIGIPSAEAITNYSWSQYVYNVSLKIGTSVLGNSLLDFMK